MTYDDYKKCVTEGCYYKVTVFFVVKDTLQAWEIDESFNLTEPTLAMKVNTTFVVERGWHLRFIVMIFS